MPPAVCKAAEKVYNWFNSILSLRTSAFGMVDYLRRLLEDAGDLLYPQSITYYLVLIKNAVRCKSIAEIITEAWRI